MKKKKDFVDTKLGYKKKYMVSRKRAEDYLRGWQRARADFENLKKRVAKERVDSLKFANEDLILQVLPILDNLENAMAHAPENLKNNEWVKGLDFVLKQFYDIISENDVEAIESIGKKFDPNLHEAIETKKGKKDIILEESLKGYKMGNKVIRVAKVVVGK